MTIIEKIQKAQHDSQEIFENLIDSIITDINISTASTVKQTITPIKNTSKVSKSRVTINSGDKAVIIQMFKEGSDTLDVLEEFPIYSKGQLGAIKAHVTMGNY